MTTDVMVWRAAAVVATAACVAAATLVPTLASTHSVIGRPHGVARELVDTDDCCPTCSCDADCCVDALVLQDGFTGSHACQAVCPGGCLLSPDSTTWTCVVDECGPAPCVFDFEASASDSRQLGTHRIGDCKPGHGWDHALNKTSGEIGAQTTALNISHTIKDFGTQTLVPALGLNGGGEDIFPRVVGNTFYWLETSPHSTNHFLHMYGEDGLFVHDFALPSDGDTVNYAASDSVVIAGVRHNYKFEWTAYRRGEPNTTLSVHPVPFDMAYYNYDWHWGQVYGTTGIVVTPADNGPNTVMYYWDAEDPKAEHTFVNVTFQGCQMAGESLDSLREWRVLCSEDIEDPASSTGGASTSRKGGDLSGCTLFFAAIGPRSSETRSFCKMDVDTGAVTPLISNLGPHYPRAKQGGLAWHPSGLVYGAESWGSGPETGDTMVFLFKENKLRWLNDEINHDCFYDIADAFVNWRQPGPVNGDTDIAVVNGDVAVVQVTPMFGEGELEAVVRVAACLHPVCRCGLAPRRGHASELWSTVFAHTPHPSEIVNTEPAPTTLAFVRLHQSRSWRST